jgi:hypothetical protein
VAGFSIVTVDKHFPRFGAQFRARQHYRAKLENLEDTSAARRDGMEAFLHCFLNSPPARADSFEFIHVSSRRARPTRLLGRGTLLATQRAWVAERCGTGGDSGCQKGSQRSYHKSGDEFRHRLNDARHWRGFSLGQGRTLPKSYVLAIIVVFSLREAAVLTNY